MKKGTTIFLKLAILALGFIGLGLCIIMFWGLAGEGIRNMTYFDRLLSPIVLIMWLTLIPFFIALFQGWKLLTYVDKNIAFSQISIDALKKIKHCAFTIFVLYLSSLPQFFILADADDAPGVVLIGLVFFVGGPLTITVFSALLQKLFESAVAIKTENDLTV